MTNDVNIDPWFQTLVKSINQPHFEGLPGFPSNYTQEVFVGMSGEAALKEAFEFYSIIKSKSKNYGANSKILDFGVGWGRIIRCFYRDVKVDNLFGVDVDPKILDVCKDIDVKGHLQQIQPDGVLPFADDTFDVVYAFSVFSHLAEAPTRHWLKELVRVCKKSGTIVLTSTTDLFIGICAGSKAKPESERNHFEKMYAEVFDDPETKLKDYRAGKLVYGATGGNSEILKKDFYGWASVPLKWFQNELGSEFDVEFINNPKRYKQGIFVINRKTSIWQRFFS